ncbi:MAG: helix-turn-helix domain-containing protein [Nitrospira sp.]|nr:helix-turn-helix domain-containing protein [Nitrospira sp.]MBP0120905.1 helix-turn-helix domain-containing protein [Nitrospira sp.]MBP0127017.1 helix-turn-helix domain-containing protein [Nitrospira sp.]MBP0130051.1 helix-turn-helix domain-containing protein [Nitrospira sp.]
MESIGEFFRQARETKGLTIDEVAVKTRIRTDFVKALEAGNFATLPDQVFARGFARSYARFLGLDEDDAIQRFVQSSGAYYDKQIERDRLKLRQAEEERKRLANRKAVAVAIGIAIFTLIFLLSREQSSLLVRRSSSDLSTPTSKRTTPLDQQPQAAPPTPQPEVAPPAPKAQLSEPPVVPPKVSVESTVKPAPGPALTVSPVPMPPPIAPVASSLGSDGPLGGMLLEETGTTTDGQLVLDLEATELSWVVIQIDGGSPQEALLRPGEKGRWKGQDQFVLTLGNAGGIKGELNGKRQNPFGPSGKVARDIVIKR